MLSERNKLNADVQAIVDARTEAWGLKVSNVEIRTVELTENMVRAIAKQAEAERDRPACLVFPASGTSRNVLPSSDSLGSISEFGQAVRIRRLTLWVRR